MATELKEKNVVLNPETSEKPRDKMPTHDDVAQRAYSIWDQNGRELGNSEHHWLRAEQELSGS